MWLQRYVSVRVAGNIFRVFFRVSMEMNSRLRSLGGDSAWIWVILVMKYPIVICPRDVLFYGKIFARGWKPLQDENEFPGCESVRGWIIRKTCEIKEQVLKSTLRSQKRRIPLKNRFSSSVQVAQPICFNTALNVPATCDKGQNLHKIWPRSYHSSYHTNKMNLS